MKYTGEDWEKLLTAFQGLVNSFSGPAALSSRKIEREVWREVVAKMDHEIDVARSHFKGHEEDGEFVADDTLARCPYCSSSERERP